MDEQRKKEGLKRTSELMLSGWRLMSKHCPICLFPLMSKESTMRCPGCDASVVFETEEAIAVNQPKISIHSSDPIKNEFVSNSVSTIDMNQVSKKLGERMLSGWTMLGTVCFNTECRGTPLMSYPGKSMICVCCNGEYNKSEDGIIKSISNSVTDDEKLKGLKATTLNNSDSSHNNQHQPSKLDVLPPLFDTSQAPILSCNWDLSENDPSTKLSKKLLQGYTMLDRVCSGPCNGIVPLMRDRNGKEMCVVCDGPSASAQADSTPLPVTSVSNKARDTIRTENDEEGLDSIDDYEDELEDEAYQIQRSRLSKQKKREMKVQTEHDTDTYNRITTSLTFSKENVDVKRIKLDAREIMLKKIGALTSKMNQCDALCDIETIGAIAETITKLTQSIRSVDAMK